MGWEGGPGPAGCFVTWTCLPDKLSRGSAELPLFSRGEGCGWDGLAIIIHHQQTGVQSIFVCHWCIYSLWTKSYFTLFCRCCVLNFEWWKSYIGHCLNIASPENRDTDVRTGFAAVCYQSPEKYTSLSSSITCFHLNFLQIVLFLESHWPLGT